MSAALAIELGGEEMILLPQKAMLWPARGQLIISDVHLGKTSHFRRHGVAMPQQSQLQDIDRLTHLLRSVKPASVVFLGDLFHSQYNREWLHFKALLSEYRTTEFILVEGNHDVLEDHHYNLPNLVTVPELKENKLLFTHHPLEETHALNVCGHIHPGININGLAKQSVKLPCFYQTSSHFILPAFGSLTGLLLIDPEKGSRCFVAYGNKVKGIRF